MKFLLRIKHWQLFLLYLPIPFISFILGFIFGAAQESYSISIAGITLGLFIHGIAHFGWMYQTTVHLNRKLPSDVHMNLNIFRILFFFPIMYLSVFLSFLFIKITSNDLGNLHHLLLILPLHLFSIFCIIFCVYFTSKTIKSAELQRKVTFGDFVAEFFLLMYFGVGIWILQPRINKLISQINEQE